MITVEIRHERGNGREFGYGKYINGYAIDVADAEYAAPLLYASERVPFDASDARIAAAERRVRRNAWRRAKADWMG
jgi:hypothetical protein